MPRRIILLSDGTGNSSASFWRTNVWRMFSALELSSNDQIAYYDDGVGTSSFKPLALLGGAFGVGLRRNVISLYKFACRNFREANDEIYGFGFSRGAFTIRVVIGLILDQGLIPAGAISETELDRQAHKAYRAYHKRHFHTNWSLILKRIKQWLGKDAPEKSVVPPDRNVPVIRFLGVWDTVAAYGLPIDEMTRGVSQWLWPLEIPSHTLHPSVRRACHALSLDDERTTFHPVLWNERNESPHTGSSRFTKDERISQVWFAGVHANVGGGYPDDSLAQIPLYWIAQEAKACGLTFKTANPEAIAEIKEAQDKDGRLYDSRSGFGSYYRYGPRRISRLCNERFSRTLNDEVYVAAPKIHESVFWRIKNNAHVYAPIGIPHNYEIVINVPKPNGIDSDFRIDALPTSDAGSPVLFERQADAEARVVLERRAIWPRVYLRSLLYLATVLTTAFFIVFPMTGRANVLLVNRNRLAWVSDLIQTGSGFLPGWASSWLVSYAQYPWMFLILAMLLLVLLWSSVRIAADITDKMGLLWRDALAHRQPVPAQRPTNELNAKDRVLVGIRSSWRDYLGPALSAVAIVYAIVTIPSHWLFTAVDDAGFVCEFSGSKNLRDIPANGILFSFDVSNPCFATGYRLARLQRYFVWTTPDIAELNREYKNYKSAGSCTAAPDERLVNGSVSTDARGYDTFRNERGSTLSVTAMIWSALLLPLKRHYGQPWFQPVARYGAIGSQFDFLEPDPDPRFTRISEYVSPKVPGELFLYVNDAVTPIPGWQPFYGDNSGCISFFVK
ncbi:DUF2235 domain-containing protein [Bradyrhizobium sp.]|uniref:DUF2235 domain-containing protein n=1 Tax=Bradyrhizobium sp. TaxID=376 RepID=UPI00238C8F3E|nr:DUF2235 domain-containing protein [Bradyrhizobium sp.]MDE1934468.1 DUF2235 domain-containing protein [Bradyrhizobium sp.]